MEGKVSSPPAHEDTLAAGGSLLQFGTATHVSRKSGASVRELPLHSQAFSSKNSPDFLSLLAETVPRAAGLNYVRPDPGGFIMGSVLFFTAVVAFLMIGHYMQLDQFSMFQRRNSHLHMMQTKMGSSRSGSSGNPSTRQLSSQQTLFSSGRPTREWIQEEPVPDEPQHFARVPAGAARSFGPASQRSLSSMDRADVQRLSEGGTSKSLAPRVSPTSFLDGPFTQEANVASDSVPPTAHTLSTMSIPPRQLPPVFEKLRHLNVGYVVPRGQECSLLVPDVQSVALRQCTHVFDINQQQVMRVDVSIPQRTTSGLDQCPAVFLQSIMSDATGKHAQVFCKIEARAEHEHIRFKMYVYNGFGDLFATLTRITEDSLAKIPRYVLSSIGSNIQMYFIGDFKGSKLMVRDDSRQVLAETCAPTRGQVNTDQEGPTDSPFRYHLKVWPSVDASLVVASLMSIQLMELVAVRDAV